MDKSTQTQVRNINKLIDMMTEQQVYEELVYYFSQAWIKEIYNNNKQDSYANRK